MTPKTNLILHHDSLDVLDQLSDEQAGKLLKAICAYSKSLNEEVPVAPSGMDPIVNIVFIQFKSQLLRDFEKYQKTCLRNKDNAQKRWDAVACEGMPKVPVDADSDSDTIEIRNDSDTIGEGDAFSPTTILLSKLETVCAINSENAQEVAQMVAKIPEADHPAFIYRCQEIQNKLTEDGLSRYKAINLIPTALQTLNQIEEEIPEEMKWT